MARLYISGSSNLDIIFLNIKILVSTPLTFLCYSQYIITVYIITKVSRIDKCQLNLQSRHWSCPPTTTLYQAATVNRYLILFSWTCIGVYIFSVWNYIQMIKIWNMSQIMCTQECEPNNSIMKNKTNCLTDNIVTTTAISYSSHPFKPIKLAQLIMLLTLAYI
jgi:hypothetical protein